MKRFLLSSIMAGIFIVSLQAQKIQSENYHTHRTPLVNTFIKCQQCDTVRIAFLGGSITYNHGWRDSLCLYFQERFPKAHFDFINAGIPSMGLVSGAFRFKRDVLKRGPVDLLLVETIVNDAANDQPEQEIERATEGIIRHAFMSNPDMDIVMMHFVDPGKMANYRQGKVPEIIQIHHRIEYHYKIPVINLAKEVTERIDAGEFSWDHDFKNLHTSPSGHSVYYQSMRSFFEFEWLQCDGKYAIHKKLPLVMNKDAYYNGKLIVADTTLQTDTLTHFFKGNTVGIAVASGPNAGTIEYQIDKNPWKQLDLITKHSQAPHLPRFYTLASGLKDKPHTLQLLMVRQNNPDSFGEKAVIRYFYENSELKYANRLKSNPLNTNKPVQVSEKLTSRRNHLVAGIGGLGALGTVIHYERDYYLGPKGGFSAGVGLTFEKDLIINQNGLSLQGKFFTHRNHFSFLGGLGMIHGKGESFYFLILEGRIHFLLDRCFFGLSITPLFNPVFILIPWGGVSLGFNF